MSTTLLARARRGLFPALFMLCACGHEPSSRAPRSSPPSSATARSPVARIFEAYVAAAPGIGRDAGMHHYDGVVRDYSSAAIQQRITDAHRDREELGAVDRRALSPDAALDLDIVRWALDEELFDLEARALFRTDPASYGELFDVASYLDNEGVTLERRTERVIRHEEAALAQVPHVYENLRLPLSRPVAEVAAGVFAGYAESLRGDIAARVRAGTNAAQKARFETANTALANEADRLTTWLRREVIPNGNDSHVLGRARFERLVTLYAGTSLPLDRFKAIGQEDLDRNRKAYDVLAKTVVPKRPTEAEYLATASRLVESARTFIEEKHVVTITTTTRRRSASRLLTSATTRPGSRATDRSTPRATRASSISRCPIRPGLLPSATDTSPRSARSEPRRCTRSTRAISSRSGGSTEPPRSSRR